MPVPMATSAVPAASMAPTVPVPAAVIPAVEAMPPIWPIVASVAVVARIVAVAGITVIAAVPRRIIAATKRESHLRLSRALRSKEQAACCDQNNERFHALNLMSGGEPRI
jgi:hypothetical protein